MKKNGILIVALFLFSFSVVSAETSCSCDSECGGYSCTDNDNDGVEVCETSCTEDSGCSAGYSCNGGTCRENSPTDGATCSLLGMCEGGYACDDAVSSCYDSCTYDGQCYEGYTCDTCSSTCVIDEDSSSTESENLVVEETCSEPYCSEFVDGNVLPWVLGGVGILLIAGISYWFFTKKRPVKKSKKK